MRTTINMPKDLLARAKRAALDADTTLTDFITEAVRQALLRKQSREASPAVAPMPRYVPQSGQGGLQPGVDLNDSAALQELLDEADAAH